MELSRRHLAAAGVLALGAPALIRSAHRTPFTLASDYTKIDEQRLTASLFREASAITGPGQIRSVVVTSQTPRRRISTPAA